MLHIHWSRVLLTWFLVGLAAFSQHCRAAEPAAEVAENKELQKQPQAKLTAGDHTRKLVVDGQQRSYLVHVPRKYDAAKPTPVVLILHGAFTNAAIMVHFCGMNAKANEAGFIAVYPNGTGPGMTLFFNAGSIPAMKQPDDVAFVDKEDGAWSRRGWSGGDSVPHRRWRPYLARHGFAGQVSRQVDDRH